MTGFASKINFFTGSCLPVFVPRFSPVDIITIVEVASYGRVSALRGGISKMRKYLWVIPILFAVIRAPNAHAQTTYTYTGNDFTNFVGLPAPTCPPDCSIDGSFTVSSPLAASTTTTAIPPAFDFYISTADSPSWTNLNGTFVLHFIVTTNSIGAISAWNIALNSPTAADMFTQGNIPTDEDLFIDGGEAGNVNDPGTWTVTPEPSSLTLWLLGIFAVGIMTRRARTLNRPIPSLL